MRTITKVLVFFFSFVLAFVFALGIATIILQEKIIAKSLELVNKQLEVSLTAKEIRVSLIRHFPMASIRMRDAKIIEGSLAIPHDLEPGLLSLEEITLKIGLIGILKNEYSFDELVLKNGWLNLYFDNSGKGNFEIFKKSEETYGSWLLSFEAIRLQNVSLSYIDLPTRWIFKGLVENATIRGDISSNQISLNLQTRLSIGSLRQGNFYYIRNQKAILETEFLISDTEVLISPSTGVLGRNKLSFYGHFGRNSGDLVKIEVVGREFEIESLMAFVSQHNIKLPPQTKTKGNIGFNLSVTGKNKDIQPFQIKFDFNTQDFELQIPNKPTLSLKMISGSFNSGSYGKPESSELFLSNMQVESGVSSASGSLRIKNIFSPLFHLKVQHSLSLPDFKSWGIDIPFSEGIVYGNTEVLGKLENFENITLKSFEDTKFNSDVSLKGVVFEQVGSIPELKNVSGKIRVSNQDISHAALSGLIHGSKFEAEIQAKNATAILFGNQFSTITANIVVDSLNTGWLTKNKDIEAEYNGSSIGTTLDRIKTISGDIFIDKFVHNQFVAQPLSANFYFGEWQLFCNSFLARSCNGMFTGRFNIASRGEGHYNMAADVAVDDVSIEQLFDSFNSFGQKIITSQNISGLLNGRIAMASPIINGELVSKKLDAEAMFKITNGRLVDVKQLEVLSRFVELEELKEIKFKTLENTLRVSEQKIVIPEMDIQSSAFNFTASGTHEFSGAYLYRVQVLLSDALFGKASRKKPENIQFGEVEEDGSGNVKLYLKLEGDSNDIKVTYDAAKAREVFRQNLRQERETIRSILLDEFRFLRRTQIATTSVFGSDTLIDLDKKPKLKSKSKQESPPKFIIEWDD